MAVAKKSKLESAIDDLQSEERRLNNEIDQVNAQIKANTAADNSEAEIETAACDTVRRGADRYRELLKFALRTSDLKKMDIMPIQPFDFRAGVMPTKPNLQLLVDGFYFLMENTPGAIERIMAMAPRGGSTKGQREKIDAALQAKKLELEGQLEGLYQDMEQAGFQPRRRPDLSARVFLNFVDKANWSRRKLEAQRQRLSEIRAAQSKLTAKRSELIQERVKLENLVDDHDDDSRLKNDIEKLKVEETLLSERILANQSYQTRD